LKIVILTFQESSNYGALFQAYALQTKIEKLINSKCEILNYHSTYKATQYSINLKKSLAVFLNKLFSKFIINKVRKNSSSFKKRYLNIAKKVFYSSEQMKELSGQYDLFFCGSDQVWNAINTGEDSTYFLDFVKDINKKVAYAPSIALPEIPENLIDFYKKNINGFMFLSVREESGAKLIEELTDKKAEVVLDPTLLLNQDEWLSISKPINYKKPYIFVYYISYLPQLINFAKKLSKETGLQVILPLRTVRDYFTGFNCKIISPEHFIDSIANAEYVVTNSFHGIAFSVNFKKEFFSFGKDFLKLIKLQDRFIDNNFLDNEILQNYIKINYSKVSQILDSEKKKSIEFIKSALK